MLSKIKYKLNIKNKFRNHFYLKFIKLLMDWIKNFQKLLTVRELINFIQFNLII